MLDDELGLPTDDEPATYGKVQLAADFPVLDFLEAEADDSLWEAMAAFRPRRVRKPRIAPPDDGLRTKQEAADKLHCSVKTLNGHIASGALRYVVVGHGTKRTRRMLTDSDLDAFIEAQTRKDAPACPFTEIRARRTGSSISGAEVIAFSAAPRPRAGAKPKR
jgi:hypothetical protein